MSSQKAVSVLRGAIHASVVAVSLGWAVDLPRIFSLSLFTEQMLGVVLTLCIVNILLWRIETGKDGRALSWIYGGLALLVLGGGLYIVWGFERFVMIAAFRPIDLVLASLALTAGTFMAVRLTSGLGITLVVLLFIVYALLGHLAPGEFRIRPVSFEQLAVYLGTDANGILGIALSVACIIVIPFILFGQCLSRFGAGDFFTDLASAVMGRFRGGAAKISIAASALFGTISGSAVGNVVGSGVITIPLMKRAGFKGSTAGAVEAVASTGGQIMPPVMGAAAFLMAEFLEMSYGEVMVAALLPAGLYFLALFIQVDLLAARHGIAAIPRDEIPKVSETIKSGWHFVLPFVVLIVCLFNLNLRPELSALAACGVLTACAFVFGYRGKRPSPAAVWRCVLDTGNAVKEIVAICAAAGIVIGVLNLTGLAFNLTLQLIMISGDSVIVLVIVTALVSIVLGMGMPTVGVYVLLATLVAPALIEAGIQPLAAHMFVLYFGMLSMITPPVALAAFTGANLAEADPWRTSLDAVRLGWSAYIVPFLFVASPTLLFVGSSTQIVWAAVTAVVGVWAVTSGIVGYFNGPIKWPQRMLLVAAGLAVLIPADAHAGAVEIEIAGLAILVGYIAYAVRGRLFARGEPAGPSRQ